MLSLLTIAAPLPVVFFIPFRHTLPKIIYSNKNDLPQLSLIAWATTEHNNDVQTVTEKVIMWAQWCFYLNYFFSSRQGTSNPPPTMFLPQLTISSKRMLGSSKHKSEWHWECNIHNERGHAEPLSRKGSAQGVCFSATSTYMANYLCFIEPLPK